MRFVKYLIIGAGVSGLTFAQEKRDQDYLILEKEAVAGGLCRSFYEQGFVWDVAGHFFHFHSEKTRAFYEELMRGESMRDVEKHAKVYYAGKYMDAPFQYNIHQLPPEEFLECLTDLYFCNPHQLVRDERSILLRREFFRRYLSECDVYMVNTTSPAKETQERIRSLIR